MNLHQKINEVRKKVAYLQKDKEVGGKYKAVTHDAVTAAVREHLIEHEILVVPRLRESESVVTGVSTAKGIPYIRYEATYAVEFVDCANPADKLAVVLDAHAMDEGDKAPGKAISYATKYAMLKLFTIETGDDEEARPVMKAAAISKIDEMGQRIIDANIKPNADALKNLTMEQHVAAEGIATDVQTFTATKDYEGAEQRFYSATFEGEPLTQELQLAVWAWLTSTDKSGITKIHRAKKGAEIGS